MQLTAVYVQTPSGFEGYVEELQGAVVRGTSLSEVRETLQQVVVQIMETNRQLAESLLAGSHMPFLKESLSIGCGQCPAV